MLNSGPSVLIVEDDKELAAGLRDLLDSSGFRVAISATPRDAIQKLTYQQFQCVVLDMKLAGGSGEAVISFMRDPKGMNHRTPILVTSGTLDSIVIKRIGNEVDGVLVKPVDPAALVERVKALSKAEH
jgi:DNA-binding response OmpR family regulator